MNIKSITLSSFRAHKHFTLPLSPVTLITGPNGSGKSTIMAAIEYVTSGKCYLTNERGTGGELATTGAKAGTVDMELSGGERFARRTDGTLSLSWEPRCKASDAQYKLEQAIGCKGDAARLAIRASRFFGMDAKAQKTLLSEVLGLDVDAATVMEALASKGKAASLPLLDVVKRVGLTSLAAIERCYKACYDERTAEKRLVKELSAQVEAYTADSDVFTPEAEVASKTARLSALRSEMQSLDRELGGLHSASKAREAAASMLERAAIGYKDAYASALEVGSVDGHSIDVCPPTEFGCDRAIAALDAEMRTNADAASQLGALSREFSAAKAEVARLTTDVANAGMCPWSDGTPCAGAAIRAVSIQDQLDVAGAKLANIEARLSDLKDSIRAMRSSAAIQAELTEARSQREAASTQARIRTAASLRLQHATRALEVERERMTALTDDPERLAEIEAYRPGLQSAIDEISADLDILRGNAALKAQRDSVRERLKTAELSARCLEELVAFFAPTGYQAELLSAQLSPLVDTVNGILSRWGLAIRYDAALTLEVNAGAWLPYHCLADSAQILVGLAHQVAFAILPGSCTGLVVVDRIESLDDDSQRTLMEACEELAQSTPGLHHILLLGVRCVEGGMATRIDLGRTSLQAVA